MVISSGRGHTCGQRFDETVICWGDDYPTPYPTSPPYQLPPVPLPDPVPPFTAISSGRHHTCALGQDGTAVCWGQNDHRQASPPLGKTFRSINSGASHTCGLETNGTLICWGALGDRRVPQMGTFAELSTGGGFIITESGHGVCRGNDFYGQARSPFEEQFIAMSGGGRHVCGLRQDGSVRCWGDDDYGQTTPPKGERFVAISVGPRTRADCVRAGSFYAGNASRTANRRPRRVNVSCLSAAVGCTHAGYGQASPPR